MFTRQISFAILLVISIILLGACSAPVATPTAPPPVLFPAPTQVSPTAVPATSVPPTAVSPTIVPPTLIPPTNIPVTTAPTEPPANAGGLKLMNQVNGGFVSQFGWSADNQVLTVHIQDALTQYNASDLKATNTISTTFAAQVFALSPDGMKVVGLAQDQSVQIWNAATGQPLTKLQNAALPIGAIFTPDGSMVATFSGDKIEIQMWDAKAGTLVQTLSGFETAAPVYSAVFAPDNKTMAWVSRATVQFMDMASGKLGEKLQFEDFVGGAQFTPDSQSFVTLDTTTVNNQPVGTIQVWNVADGKMLQQLTNAQFFTGLSIAPQGTLLATGVGNTIQIWDWKKGGDATGTNAPGQIATLDFSNDGKLLATGDQDGNIVMWSVP